MRPGRTKGISRQTGLSIRQASGCAMHLSSVARLQFVCSKHTMLADLERRKRITFRQPVCAQASDKSQESTRQFMKDKSCPSPSSDLGQRNVSPDSGRVEDPSEDVVLQRSPGKVELRRYMSYFSGAESHCLPRQIGRPET